MILKSAIPRRVLSCVVFTAISMGAFALGRAQESGAFKTGQVLRAAMLNEWIVPSGAVMAFDLDRCPVGWTAHEPAAGRVIVGIDPDGALRRGQSVGSNSVVLSVDNLPRHRHSGTTDGGRMPAEWILVEVAGDAFQTQVVTGFSGANRAKTYPAGDVFPGSAHVHDFETRDAGRDVPIDNRQDSLPLLYCKKSSPVSE